MNALEKFKDIHTFIFDVDGVMTDSLVHVTERGEFIRRFNIRDGYAIRQALDKGYRVIVITAGKSDSTKKRMDELGVTEAWLGATDKLDVLKELVAAYDLDLNGTLYMGDDIPDYEAMRRVHFPVCPANAVREIRSISQYMSPYGGGEGCVRDVIEKVMLLQGKWPLSS